MMKPVDAKRVIDTIENEGFAYTFIDYSNFEDIESEEFHELRREFVDSAEKLAEYLGVDV